MKKRLRAVVTITMEYTADSKNYINCKSVKDMIDFDSDNFGDDPFSFIDGMIDNGDLKIEIEEVHKP